MMGWLQSLESSSWSIWLQESPSIWGYPTLLFFHTLGLAFSAGPSIAVDLRILGVARRLPLAPLDAFFKVIWIAVAVNTASGAVLFASDATAKLANPAFIVKMTCVLIAIIMTVMIRRRVVSDSLSIDGTSRFLAAASIICWFGAITAGRLMAYL
jgi:hypothetical protein